MSPSLIQPGVKSEGNDNKEAAGDLKKPQTVDAGKAPENSIPEEEAKKLEVICRSKFFRNLQKSTLSRQM